MYAVWEAKKRIGKKKILPTPLFSHVVTHHSTQRAHSCLITQIGRDGMYS